MDDHERFNESELTVWVAGGKTVPKRNVEQEEAQIIPNKKEYAPEMWRKFSFSRRSLRRKAF